MTTERISEVSSSECWNFLRNNISESRLIDVRSEDEWKNYGIPDLNSVGKQVDLITLLIFEQEGFVEELGKRVPNKNTKLFFICASGGRSAKAAELAAKSGYASAFNVNDGFLGNMLDENYKPLNANGWKNVNLPWRIL